MKESVMNQDLFDQIILNNLIAKLGTSAFGYIAANNGVYDTYYTNNEFQNFITEMKINHPVHYSAYAQGKGSELLPGSKNGTPPKMASVASSSRFCYLALRNGAHHLQVNSDVVVEHECPIIDKPNIQPQLDAYSLSGNTYVEVKCHEIFIKSKTKTLGKSYVDYIYGSKYGIGFKLPIDCKPTAEFKIPHKEFGLSDFPTYFDLKQFLCHLLGIACQNKGKDKPATLAYLFFRPKTSDNSLNQELLSVFTKLQAEIISIFASQAIKDFCKENNIILKAYYEYSEVMEPLTASNTHPLFS